jgi:CheY-like chemotaxis protein
MCGALFTQGDYKLMPAKILLADDSITIQKMVHQAFENGPYELFLVGNGEAAIRKLQEFHADLVLADIYMPGKNGYEVCEYIKNQPDLASIPVVLLVGAFEPFDEAEAARVGAAGHLTKPFAPKMLSETVEKYLSPGPAAPGAVEPHPFKDFAALPLARATEWHAEHDKTVPVAPRVEGPEVPPWFQAVPMEEPGLPAMSHQTESMPDGPPSAPAVVESVLEAPAEVQPILAEEAHSQASMDPLEVPIGEPKDLAKEDVTEEFADFRRGLALHAEPNAAPSLEHPAESALLDAPPSQPEKAPTTVEALRSSIPSSIEHGGGEQMTQGQAETIRSRAVLPVPELSEATIDAIARRVIEKMSFQVVEEVAWEVVPEVAEMMLRKIITEKK